MRRIELVALRSRALLWERLQQDLPPSLEAVGLASDEAATDGELTLRDHGDGGCVVLFDDTGLARRAALALARRAGVQVEIFEVVGSSGGKRNRFRTKAFTATVAGELKDAEGQELDLEDPDQTWGGGALADQAGRVLSAFALLEGGAGRTLHLGYKKKPAGRPSTPRVATLLASLQKARSWQAAAQPDGRFELKIELAAGGRQISFCSAAEHGELVKLLGAKG